MSIEPETLSENECIQLLQSRDIGRLALVVDGRPKIFPVNYLFEDGVVVFRSSAGLKLEHSPMTSVAFEVDESDPQTGLAWSVVVEGVAQRITDAVDSRSVRLREVPVQPLAPGAHEEQIGIYVEKTSGRRFAIET